MLPAKIPVIDLFTGDTLPILEFGITKSDGSGALNLSSATAVRVKIRLMGGTVNQFGTLIDIGTIANPPGTDGTVQYALPGTLSDVGDYFGQVEVTFPAGAQSTSRFQLHVAEGL